MRRFIVGSKGLILDGRPFDPLSIGQQIPNLQGSGLAICESFQRMLERYHIPYYREEDGNLYKIVLTEAQQLCLIEKEIRDVNEAHHVSTADGFSLEALGILLGVTRREGESDSSLAARIKVKLPTLTGGGTIPHLQKIVAAELGILPANVSITDGYLRPWHGPHYEYILKLDNNALDWEGNHNGVAVGSPTYASGRFSDGLSQPTDANYIRIPDDADFDTESFAVWAWISPANVAGVQYIKIKSDGTSAEWYIRVNAGKVEGFVDLVTSDAFVDSGTDLIKANKTYFVMMVFDGTTKVASLYVCEDGLKGYMTRPSKYVGSAGTGGRTYLSTADIYLGKNPIAAGQTWSGWIDHVGYVKGSAPSDKLVDELCYCAPGLDHYAHFTITIIGVTADELAAITPEEWQNAENAVNENKAAGVTFEGFTNGPIDEDIEVSDDGSIYHHTEITWTESLNITYPG